MKTRVTALIVAAVLALGVTGTHEPAQSHPQTEPEKRPGPTTQPSPTEPKPGTTKPGAVGAPVTVETTDLKAQVDSTMQRMAVLIEQSKKLSVSFGKLAQLHHGADRSEILMMQRVSDAMGTMAGELMVTLDQYKRMLDYETSTESGAMKAEVQGLKGAMEVIAGEVDDALQTLQRLQTQLGQG